jgi:phosphate transport system permease protein
MAVVPLAIMVILFSFLIYNAIPSMRYSGFDFFTSYIWNPGMFYRDPIMYHGVPAPYKSSFGMLSFFVGTMITTAFALVIAFPVSIFLSLTLNLYTPRALRRPFSAMVELFAGIPSVVYGLWGVIVLEPILLHRIEPWMKTNLSFIPGFSGEVFSGAGIIAAGLILGIMIIPIVTAVISESMASQPKEFKEGVYALGGTKWEVGRHILLRNTRRQIAGGTLLGTGRALGETMAVLMVSGAVVNVLPTSIFSLTNTMSAQIAAALDSAFIDATGMNISALVELGVILVVISLIANLAGRAIAGKAALRGYEND